MTGIRSVVVHAPQGSGMTPYAHRLRRHFGLSFVLHEDNDGPFDWTKPLPNATLVLARTAPPDFVGIEARVLTFREASRLAGFA